MMKDLPPIEPADIYVPTYKPRIQPLSNDHIYATTYETFDDLCKVAHPEWPAPDRAMAVSRALRELEVAARQPDGKPDPYACEYAKALDDAKKLFCEGLTRALWTKEHRDLDHLVIRLFELVVPYTRGNRSAIACLLESALIRLADDLKGTIYSAHLTLSTMKASPILIERLGAPERKAILQRLETALAEANSEDGSWDDEDNEGGFNDWELK
jgi:hypothetical protein